MVEGEMGWHEIEDLVTVPSELSEQIALADVLRAAGLVWWHTPNGGRRDRAEAARLRQAGVEAGVPDVLIVSPAPGAPRGAALELKRQNGRWGDVSPDQWVWLARLEAVGFVTIVAFGWRDAVHRLRAIGYALPEVGAQKEAKPRQNRKPNRRADK